MAKFFGGLLIIFTANIQKTELIRHLGMKAYEEVEEYL
jgi:hypothetical protein